MTYAYARVSARDQNLTRQIEAFEKFGLSKDRIFCDKKSGKNFERRNYLRLIKRLKSGDLLVIKSIDRLGRNYEMIIEEWSRITNKIKANILVLGHASAGHARKSGHARRQIHLGYRVAGAVLRR